jgi:hypothetical protein
MQSSASDRFVQSDCQNSGFAGVQVPYEDGFGDGVSWYHAYRRTLLNGSDGRIVGVQATDLGKNHVRHQGWDKRLVEHLEQPHLGQEDQR